jgi:nitrogen fixation protein
MIRLSDNLEVNKPAPVDDRLGVFSSTANALAYIAEDRRYIGLTLIVDTGSGAEEYWFESGVENADLVAKSTGGGGASWGTITGTLSSQTDLQNALDAKVPYTGATQNVDLGTYNITADQVNLNVTPTGTLAVGGTQWNNTIGSSETLLKGGSVTLKNGVDLVARVVNKVNPNTTLTKASYQVVKVAGAQGQRLAVELARANNDLNSADTLGMVIETIAPNQEGFILTVGQIENINTTGSLQGETWADGDVLYLSPTTAGVITNVKPNGLTGHIVVIGYVEYAHANNGKIYVKIMNGWELAELHDVYINPATLANNDALIYDSTAELWENTPLTKSLVGLGNVDNTSDANKPISTATQTALDRITTLFQNVSQLTTTSTTAVTLTTFTVASSIIPVGGVIRISGLIERTAGTGNTTVGINVNSGGARYLQSAGTNSQFEILICKTTSTNVRYGLGASNTTGNSFTGHNSTSISVAQDGSGNFVISFLGLVGTTGATLTLQFVKGNLL